MKNSYLSMVIPCYNEDGVIQKSISAIGKYIDEIGTNYEIIIVDDGSTDESFEIIKKLAFNDERIRGIRFTRNFGKEAAILAGLRASTGDAVVLMDSDLQHPPDILITLFKFWKQDGYEIVEGVKSYRDKAFSFSKGTSLLFNFLMSKLTGLNMHGASDYKLMDRRVVDKIIAMPERNRFFRGLVNWTGYRTKQVPFDVKGRVGGQTKWSHIALLRLSISAITSFSNLALQLVTLLGVFTLIFSIVLTIQTLYNKISGDAVSGFTTVIILSLILNSVIMISLGIIGIYLSNIYIEIKGRPFYIVAEEVCTKKED